MGNYHVSAHKARESRKAAQQLLTPSFGVVDVRLYDLTMLLERLVKRGEACLPLRDRRVRGRELLLELSLELCLRLTNLSNRWKRLPLFDVRGELLSLLGQEVVPMVIPRLHLCACGLWCWLAMSWLSLQMLDRTDS